MDLTPGQRGSVEPPPRSAPFSAKMDYYRSQHTTKGVRATHIVGIPGVAFAIPVVFARPRVGLQVAGHMIFEKNSPALSKGFFTYQFCGLAFWCEEMVDLISGKGIGGADHPVVTIPESATTAS
jgi:uncharacterized membrane protein YGL010W